MEEEKRRAYSEVVEILKLIEDEKKLESIPFEVIELIKNNSDPTYKPQISKNIPFEEQNISKEAYGILGWIASKYWGEDVLDGNTSTEISEEKLQVSDISESKEEVTEEVNVYSDIDRETIEKTELPMVIQEPNWFKRIIEKISKIFKKIFKRESINETNSRTI